MTPYTTQRESVTIKVLGRATHSTCSSSQPAGAAPSNITAEI